MRAAAARGIIDSNTYDDVLKLLADVDPGEFDLGAAMLSGGWFLARQVTAMARAEDSADKRAFLASLMHLAVLFGFMVGSALLA